jgi:hypothetical protein
MPLFDPQAPGSTSAAGLLQLDGTAGHIQPVGTSASAGNQGLAADSKHQHAWGQAAPAGFMPSNPSTTVSASTVMMGLGTTCTYTPAGTGNVLVNVTGCVTNLTATTSVTPSPRYGTGTAPANGAAVTGTRFGAGIADQALKPPGVGQFAAFAFTALLALTPATAYWFDVGLSTGNPSDAASMSNVSMTIAELP